MSFLGVGSSYDIAVIHFFLRYEQEVEDAFHVSKACLEPGSAGDGITSVYIESGSEEFIVSNLGSQKLSDDLDLNFILGESICFRVEVNLKFTLCLLRGPLVTTL